MNKYKNFSKDECENILKTLEYVRANYMDIRERTSNYYVGICEHVSLAYLRNYHSGLSCQYEEVLNEFLNTFLPKRKFDEHYVWSPKNINSRMKWLDKHITELKQFINQ